MGALGGVVVYRYFGSIDKDGQTISVVVQTPEHFALRQAQVGLGSFVVAALANVFDVLAQALVGDVVVDVIEREAKQALQATSPRFGLESAVTHSLRSWQQSDQQEEVYA